jgi:hypothetical protein
MLQLSDLTPEGLRAEIARRREENGRMADIAAQFKSAMLRQRDVDAVPVTNSEGAT